MSSALDNSRPLDVHRWSAFPEVGWAVAEIESRLTLAPRRKRDGWSLAIKLVALNLYVTALISPEMYVGYHRRPTEYRVGSRYNALHIGREIIAAIDAMERAGLIENHKGFYDRRAGGRSRISRMRATPLLLDIIHASGITPPMIGRATDEECIILRAPKQPDGKRGRKIDYDETDAIRDMRSRLRAYNDLMARADVRLTNEVYEAYRSSADWKERPVDYSRKFSVRVFNNGRWDHGGRYARAWWTNCPKRLRDHILIDGEPTWEYDYSAIHIWILYAMEGMDFGSVDREDAYSLPTYRYTDPFDRENMRAVLKQVLLIAINADSPESTVRAVRSALSRKHRALWTWVKAKELDLSDIVDAFGTRHAPISGHLRTGIGIRLQNLDSRVASVIIDECTERGVPVLCIHDSFLIARSKRPLLEWLMERALDWVMKDAVDPNGPPIVPRIKSNVVESWENTAGNRFGDGLIDEVTDWDPPDDLDASEEV